MPDIPFRCPSCSNPSFTSVPLTIHFDDSSPSTFLICPACLIEAARQPNTFRFRVTSPKSSDPIKSNFLNLIRSGKILDIHTSGDTLSRPPPRASRGAV